MQKRNKEIFLINSELFSRPIQSMVLFQQILFSFSYSEDEISENFLKKFLQGDINILYSSSF